MDVQEEELHGLYTWVDGIPLSRPKRHIARDFADGVLMAEVVAHYFPKLVQIHNYSPASGLPQKVYNWNTLNQKVFKRLGMTVGPMDLEAIVNASPGAVERVLKLTRKKIALHQGRLAAKKRAAANSVPATAIAKEGGLPGGERHNGGAEVGEAAGLKGHQYAGNACRKDASGGETIAASGRADESRGDCGGVVEAAAKAGKLSPKALVMEELRETNKLLEAKVHKLEQLVRLKDAKIQSLLANMRTAGLV